MNLRRTWIWLVGLFCILQSVSVALADVNKLAVDLSDAFELTPGAKQSMIVYLADRVDVAALDAALCAQHRPRVEHHRIVVSELQRTAERSQGPVRDVLNEMQAAGEVDGYKAFWIVNAFVVYGSEQAAQVLTDRSDVDYVELNFEVELIDPIRGEPRELLDSDANTPPIGIRALNAPRVWYELGVTGAGALVANCDTGVEGVHPALSGRWRGNFAPAAQCWRAPVSGSSTPVDNDQHGTHVMGTICGATNGGTGDTTGVAPGALWIADDAIGGGTGSVFDNNVIDAYQWMADPDGNINTVNDVPDVCQNSWGVNGSFSGYSDCDNRWNAAIQGLEAATCVVTFSAGNEGPSAASHRSPANVAMDSVTFFSIGAADLTSDTLQPYTMASFSSRGPSDCNGSIKPEVIAPGVSVYSSIPGSTYSSAFSGTSMAGPHVAGIVGLMRSANPDVDVRTIKSIIMRTAHDQDAAGKDNTSGWGFVDAYAAVLQVISGYGRIAGVIRDESTLNPLQAQVEIVGGAQLTNSNGSGAYVLVVPGDSTYTVRYSLYGYVSQDVQLTVAANDTTVHDVLLHPRPVVYLLNENFDSGAPGWSHSASAGWSDQWHVSTERAQSAPNSYKCGDPGTGTYGVRDDALLVSPVIPALPAEARLRFSYQIESELSGAYPDSAYDGGVLELSMNGGAFAALAPVGGYPKTFRILAGGGNPVTGPLAGRPCWAGSQTTWRIVEVDLSAYVDRDVQLRWRFGSDAGTGLEGWYVDDVVVSAFGPETLAPVANLVVSVSGNDLRLFWENAGSAAYRIYSDVNLDGGYLTFVDQTADTTYTVVNGWSAQNELFYIVRSWNGVNLGPLPRGGVLAR
ncbi:S8 family serine peptidase [candidate division KSB1 bacterium]|nr:S8 family serine peptidase [candidate division KSB1 bacterium]